MVSLAVVGILTSIAVPSFSRLMLANRLSTQTTELTTSLKLARAEAVRRAQPVTLAASSASNFAQGWTVFPDADMDGSASSTTSDTDGRPTRVTDAFSGNSTMQRVSCSSPTNCTVASDAARGYVVFTSRGAITASADAYFRVCDPTNTAVNGRLVRVNVTGAVSISNPGVACP